MKNILIACAIAACAVQVTSATTVTASGGTTGAEFFTSAGTLLSPSNAAIRVGTYDGSIFTQFAVSDASQPTFGTAGVIAGKWLGNAGDTSNGADPFNGAVIWFEITTTADGGGLAYLTSSQTFPNNNNGVGDGISVNSKDLLLLGAGSSAGSAPYDAASNRVVIGAIPEPSVALLGALGVLGLVRRRR